MRYIVTYDIVEDDVRNQVSNYLISQGMVRIQYSVYMGDLGRAELRAVQTMLTELTKDSISNVQFFSQCTKCIDRQRSIEVIPDQWGENEESGDGLTDGVEDSTDQVSEEGTPETHQEEPELTTGSESTEDKVETDSVCDESLGSDGREEESDQGVGGDTEDGDTEQEPRLDSDRTVHTAEEVPEKRSWSVITLDDLMEFLISNNFEPVVTPIRKVRRKRKSRTTRSVVRDLSNGAVIL